MSMRLDALYESIVEVEELIADATLKRDGIEEDAISLKNIYQILKTFVKIYDIMDDKDRKTLLATLVKNIDIYANDEGAGIPLKSIEFNFPVYKEGEEVRRVFWETQASVETLVCLKRQIQ